METDGLLRTAVTASLGVETGASDIEALSTTVLPSTGGGSFATRVERVSGAHGGTAWSVVRKHITATERVGWDRELDAAVDPDLAASLPTGLRMPSLLAWDRSHAGLTLIFDDLGSSRPPTNADLRSVTARLTTWSSVALEPRNWWSSRIVQAEHRALAARPDRIASPRTNTAHERLRRQLAQLLRGSPSWLATLDTLPIGPAHLDAYTRNLVFDADGGAGLVDWANAGLAPVGTDAATLFTLSWNYLDVDGSSPADFEAVTVDALVTALSGNGAVTPEQALAGFRSVARLRHLAMMMNAFPMVEAADPAISAIVGRPLDQIVDRWLALGDHLLSS